MTDRQGWVPSRPALLGDILSLDVRSLAVMRIGMALLLLADLWYRTHDLVAHYTDRGVIPRTVVIDFLEREGHFSLHMASGSETFIAVMVIAFAATSLDTGARIQRLVIARQLMLSDVIPRFFRAS